MSVNGYCSGCCCYLLLLLICCLLPHMWINIVFVAFLWLFLRRLLPLWFVTITAIVAYSCWLSPSLLFLLLSQLIVPVIFCLFVHAYYSCFLALMVGDFWTYIENVVFLIICLYKVNIDLICDFSSWRAHCLCLKTCKFSSSKHKLKYVFISIRLDFLHNLKVE
mgnify:CR=1 FL=1